MRRIYPFRDIICDCDNERALLRVTGILVLLTLEEISTRLNRPHFTSTNRKTGVNAKNIRGFNTGRQTKKSVKCLAEEIPPVKSASLFQTKACWPFRVKEAFEF